MADSDEFSLRLAEARDLETLVEFNLAMALETEAKELERHVLRAGVENLLREPRHGFYVVAERLGAEAVREGSGSAATPEVVGSLLVTYEWSDWRNGLFWWIQSVYVARRFRRRGIYRRLYEFVKARAAEDASVCGFRLYVERENEVAQQTYRRLGMTETHYRLFEELCRD